MRCTRSPFSGGFRCCAFCAGPVNADVICLSKMKVAVSTQLNVSAESAWQLVTQSNTLTFVTRGLMGFRPASGSFPKQWNQGETQKMRILLFGFIPAWQHQITFKEISAPKKQLLTHESGGVISVWNHLISVTEKSATGCQYNDIVEVKAGIFTPLIWLYAHAFYRYRQWRWHKLVNLHASGI